jgi:hypothetical protein
MANPNWSLLDPKHPDKGVQMSYTNGDPCWMGQPQPRYVNFIFVCGTDTRIWVAEDPQCTFTIGMTTPYACGNAGPVVTSCNHTIPELGLVWNLFPLKTINDYTTKVGGLTYSVTFCGASNITGPCSNNNNSACIFGNGFLYGLGGPQRAPKGNILYVRV